MKQRDGHEYCGRVADHAPPERAALGRRAIAEAVPEPEQERRHDQQPDQERRACHHCLLLGNSHSQ